MRKFFLINGIHLIIAHLAREKNIEKLNEAIKREDILDDVKKCSKEYINILTDIYASNFTKCFSDKDSLKKDLEKYSNDFLARIERVEDTVNRILRDVNSLYQLKDILRKYDDRIQKAINLAARKKGIVLECLPRMSEIIFKYLKGI